MYKATMKPYTVNGKTYYPTVVSLGDSATGIASWYGPKFHGKYTSNGEIYNMYAMTAANKTLPMNTMVRVTNLKNGKQVIVRINDRGPFVDNRIIDLSNAAARKIDMIGTGTAPVRLEVIGFAGKIGHGKIEKSYEGGNFMVQIGAFRSLDGANKLKNRLHGKYFPIIKSAIFGSKPIYRVFLTGFKSEDEARDYAKNGGNIFVIRQ